MQKKTLIKKGVIAGYNRGLYSVLIDGKYFQARLHPQINFSSKDKLIVGDKVKIEISPLHNLILEQETRKNFLQRTRRSKNKKKKRQIIAANIDLAIIVSSIKNPSFNPLFIDRYLVIITQANISPLICLNKIDLNNSDNGNFPSILNYYEKEMSIPVIKTSTLNGRGISTLQRKIAQKTSVFLGQSGVGKSSLINALEKKLQIKTSPVNPKTGQGRHTTTNFRLYPIGKKTYIIDTPGIRNLSLNHIEPRLLELYFTDFQKYTQQCYYRNCWHQNENGCGVKQTYKEGKIPASRYQSYLKILQEIKV